ncbi:MAG: carboxypeptidase regulatory-like domain-containing protein [Deltaproteobacteria bacterium]|nr:carboxypeptidase regulatory-like domain-containing protein [Deltaproteobacteria bacterium]
MKAYKPGYIILITLLLLGTGYNAFGLELLTKTNYVSTNYGNQISLQYTYYLDAAGNEVLHGQRTQYYLQTSIYTMHQVSLIERYSHGKKHGLEEAWYQGTYQYTIQKHWEKEYQNGELHGVSKEWYRDTGYMQSYATYSYGKLHGPYRLYDNTRGDKLLEANYQNGLLHGYYMKWIMKSSSGYTQQYKYEEGYYAYGKKDGLWKTWCTDNAYSYNWYNQRNEGNYGNNIQCGTWKNFNCNNWLTAPTYSTYAACQGATPPGVDPYDPGNPSQFEIRGHVTDSQTNVPLVGVLVQAGTTDATSNAEGFYRLVLDSSGTYSLNAVKQPDYYDFTRTVNLTDTQYLNVDIAMKPVETGGKPVITNVDPRGGEFFIEGISANNEYVVNVNWNYGNPGKVKFEVNGTPYEQTATTDGASYTFDMGTQFKGSLSPTGNTLKITAINEAGIESRPETLNPIVIPLPSWSLKMGDFEIKQDGSHLNYKLDTKWPEKPVTILVDQNYLGSTLWTLWGFVPYIGGQVFGIPDTQSFLTVEAKTDGTGSIAAGGLSGFEAAGGKIEIKLGGKGNLKYEPNVGLEWKETSLILGLTGTIERTVGPVTLIPALEGAVNLPVIGRAIGWFNERAKIKGSVSAGGETALEIMSATGEIGFNRADVETGVGVGLGTEVNVVDGLEAEIKGGGTGKVLWQVPAAPDYFKQLKTELTGSITLKFLGFEWTEGYTHPYEYPETVTTQSTRTVQSVPVLKPLSRAFLNLGPYNVLTQETQRQTMEIGGAGPLSDTKIIENVFPYSEPAIAERDGKAVIAYVYLDPDDPPHQETEINYIFYNGSTYTEPASIKNDTRAEFAPTVAYDADGKIVCVWQRVKNENFTSSDIADMAADLEIVYAVYDPAAASPAWTEPIALTDNGIMDYNPVLKRGTNGNLMLVWFSNAGNLLIGDSSSPTTIHYALWNGVDFGVTATLPATLENCFKFSLAYSGTEAMLAYMKDMDGVLVTPSGTAEPAVNDQEIFYVMYNGATWGSPVRVTDDQTPDARPQVVYRNGAAELVWLRGDSLVRLLGLTPLTTETVRENAAAAGLIDFRLYTDTDGQLVLIWQDSDEKGVDLFYSVYDTANSLWGNVLRLTESAAVEANVQGVFGTDSLYHLIFTRKDTTTGIADLYHMTYKLTADLAVDASGLTIDPAAPEPGDAVSLLCEVTNRGDLTIVNPVVKFYHGNPAAGGILLDTVAVSPTTLKAGETGLATLAWTIPTPISEYAIYAVADAGTGVVEDTTNNTAAFDIIKPDLNAVRCALQRQPDESTAIRAEIRNDGPRLAENVEVLFKAEESVIGSMTIPGILPGKTAEVVYPAALDYYDYTSTEPLISVTADPENQIREISEDNNTASFVHTLEMISPAVQDFGEVHYAGAMATITVSNKTTEALTIGSLTLTGTDTGHFQIFDNALSGTTLQPQTGGLIGVAFYPTSLGVKNATVLINDNQGKVLWQVPLTGQLDNLLQGDVNDDGAVTISDAILALQAVANMRPAGINAVVDVNGDHKIGLAEAFYALQTAAELR